MANTEIIQIKDEIEFVEYFGRAMTLEEMDKYFSNTVSTCVEDQLWVTRVNGKNIRRN
jgi:hypothetical protein